MTDGQIHAADPLPPPGQGEAAKRSAPHDLGGRGGLNEPDGLADLDRLRGEEWRRLLRAARRRLETTGGAIEGTVGLTGPSEAERRLVIGITGHYRPPTVRRLTIGLAELDAALRRLTGGGLLRVLADVDGPVRDRPAERATETRMKEQALAQARKADAAGEPWFAEWLESIGSDGTLTRLVRRGDAHLIRLATAVLDLLPEQASTPAGGRTVPLPVLAEQATGDTKALVPGTPLAALVLRALALRTAAGGKADPGAGPGADGGAGPGGVPADRAGQRSLWESAGVIVDDLASQVLVLNLRAQAGGVVSGWLDDAARTGIPFRLTLHQLSVERVMPDVPEVFVCENPAVLRAAAAELGPRSAALVCTEGVPSAACNRLLGAAAAAGARIRSRADFDWAGLRIVSAHLHRHGGTPWRMTEADYRDALAEGEATALTGTPATSPWDPGLATLIAAEQRAVMEERLLPALLGDLAIS